MQTLGYEDPVELTKTEIATVQLVESIDLFLAGKYLPAITLAGAAEGILGELLKDGGARSTIEESFQVVERLRQVTGLSVAQDKSRKDMFDEWNHARNSLKHRMDPVIVINLFDEAYWMIKRGLSNASKLGVAISNEQEFENWIIENVN